MIEDNVVSGADQAQQEYDFIIIGGGTAGCTVAGRLAEISPNVSILVVEAGKNSKGVKEISTPALSGTLVESEYDWAYQATLVDRPDFKRVENAITRGKVLGGSSSLNYYSWHRGSAALYDEWQAYGGATWGWKACKEYFSKPARLNQEYSREVLSVKPAEVGSDGPLKVKAVDPIPLADALGQAWKSFGLPTTTDIFNGKVNGLTHLVATVDGGERSTSAIFLRNHPNITVVTQTRVGRIVLSKGGDGYAASGVEIVDGTTGKPTHVLHARQEVILSAGVFASPQILLLSGIGPPKELEAHGIACNVVSPQVGKNLQEHVIFPQVFQLTEGASLDAALRPGPQHDAAVREYEEKKTGPLASPLLEFSAFLRIDERLALCKEWVEAKHKLGGRDPLGPENQPHFEYDFVPIFFHPFQPHVPVPESGDHMTIVTSLLRPLSRGTVELRSGLPVDGPAINLNFFSEELDLVAMREGGRFVREVLQRGEGMRDVIQGPYPEDLHHLDRDNESAGKLILRRCSTGYHPSGTCRFGLESGEHQGVLDERLRVRGVKNLRVIDASVFPIIPDCRIQAPVYMVAEKGAEMIRQDYEQRGQVKGPLDKAKETLTRTLNFVE